MLLCFCIIIIVIIIITITITTIVTIMHRLHCALGCSSSRSRPLNALARVPVPCRWEPDPMLVKYPSVKLILPEESPSCAGEYHPDPLISTSACDNGKTLLRKLIHSSYEDDQPDLHYLWSRFQVRST